MNARLLGGVGCGPGSVRADIVEDWGAAVRRFGRETRPEGSRAVRPLGPSVGERRVAPTEGGAQTFAHLVRNVLPLGQMHVPQLLGLKAERPAPHLDPEGVDEATDRRAHQGPANASRSHSSEAIQ